MNKILGLDLEDIIKNTRYNTFSEMISNLAESINEAEIKARLNSLDELKDELKDELQAGDNVTYINQHGISCKGYFYGNIHGEDLCKDNNGDVHVATNITKQLSKLSKQDAKNKICNILETQANPSTIQKVIDIIDSIK